MSSDYEYSDDDEVYYDDDDDMSGVQEDEGKSRQYGTRDTVWSMLTCCYLCAARAGSDISEEDMEVDGFGGGAIEPTANKRKIYDVAHESMTQADIEALIRTDLEHISSIFGITVSICRTSFDSDFADILCKE